MLDPKKIDGRRRAISTHISKTIPKHMNTKYRHKKQNVLKSEYIAHNWCYTLLQKLNEKKETKVNIRIPRIFSYNETTRQMVMQRVDGDNLSNIYGENFSDISINLQNAVRAFIKILNENSIEYIDITGYNFMLDKGDNLWIIDFEHTKIGDNNKENNPFLEKFISGENVWNPEFR